MSYKHALLQLAIASSILIPGDAYSNIVLNGDFESPGLPPTSPRLYEVGNSIGGWTVLGPDGADVAVINGPFTQFGLTFTHQSGVQSLDLTGLTNTTAGVTQSLPTVAGNSYDLTFYLGNVQSVGIWGVASSVQVRLNDSLFATATYSEGPSNAIAWKRFDYNFVATGAMTSLAFINLDGRSDNVNQIDNISVVATIPEPSTALLLALGLLGAFAKRSGFHVNRYSTEPITAGD
ncbi:MAG: DUF642 domain-containing protein [Pseudomonadota bacterium]